MLVNKLRTQYHAKISLPPEKNYEKKKRLNRKKELKVYEELLESLRNKIVSDANISSTNGLRNIDIKVHPNDILPHQVSLFHLGINMSLQDILIKALALLFREKDFRVLQYFIMGTLSFRVRW